MDDKNLRRAFFLTRIHRRPQQRIFTFWETEFQYWVISPSENECILRKGKLTCDKPRIITPETLKETFAGFSSDSVRLIENKYPELFKQLKGLGYQVKNELFSQEEVHTNFDDLLHKVKNDIPENDPASSILSAPNDLWMFAVLRLTADIIQKSSPVNFQDLEERGFFKTEDERIREEIEFLFEEATNNKKYLKDLADFLQENNLFSEYEDRFFSIARGA